jgi:hypothetical protein
MLKVFCEKHGTNEALCLAYGTMFCEGCYDDYIAEYRDDAFQEQMDKLQLSSCEDNESDHVF